MKRWLRLGAIVVVLGTVIGGASLASAGSSRPAVAKRWGAAPAGVASSVAVESAGAQGGGKGRTITVIEGLGPFKDLDLDGDGQTESAGDMTVFQDPLFNRRRTAEVGFNNISCQLVIDNDYCGGTFTLTGRGQIAVAGAVLIEDDSFFRLPITGGTGEFRTARGQATLVFPETGDDILVTFRLL